MIVIFLVLYHQIIIFLHNHSYHKSQWYTKNIEIKVNLIQLHLLVFKNTWTNSPRIVFNILKAPHGNRKIILSGDSSSYGSRHVSLLSTSVMNFRKLFNSSEMFANAVAPMGNSPRGWRKTPSLRSWRLLGAN